MKCLMTLDVTKFTGEEIGELKRQQINPRHLAKFLPDFCLTENGRIGRTDNYLQFICSGEEIYYLFDILHIEHPLAEELNNLGIEDFLDIDFNPIKTLPSVKEYKDSFGFDLSDHLVFELNYKGSYVDAYAVPEYSVEIELIGYLDRDKCLVEWTKDIVEIIKYSPKVVEKVVEKSKDAAKPL